jgi:gamma-glutamylcysteine synthetase
MAAAEEIRIGFLGIGFRRNWERKDIPRIIRKKKKNNNNNKLQFVN